MFCDIYLLTLCYYICCLLWCMYEMHPALFLKTGCDTTGLSSAPKGQTTSTVNSSKPHRSADIARTRQ
jgi:hypothetical protein